MATKMATKMATTGEWLESSLLELCGNTAERKLSLDADVISGLASYCELADPRDAAEYLYSIIGEAAGEGIIQEYLRRRGYVDHSPSTQLVQNSTLKPYVKPPVTEGVENSRKRQNKTSKEGALPTSRNGNLQNGTSISGGMSKGSSSTTRKKKGGKSISLADAAKGSVVFQQGKPCSCQARQHKLVSNCLSCGKIVCEQEGEGTCSFCGALVLKEGSTYAGLENIEAPLSEAEASAEAFAKRLVDYDRNSAARTSVIDDQSDYYEIEGNKWLSKEEKGLLTRKQQEMKEAEEKLKSKLIVTFDLVGRKIMMNEDDVSELGSEYGNSILRPAEEAELHRVKPNPTARLQPVFLGTGTTRNPARAKQTKQSNGMCLQISGRVQHDERVGMHMVATDGAPEETKWQSPSTCSVSREQDNGFTCSSDYN